MTICVECKNCSQTGRIVRGLHLCAAEAVRKPARLNWVTGEIEAPDPVYCHMVNLDGNCPHFEAKEKP